MKKHKLIQSLESEQLKNDGRSHFRVGDTVRIHTRIVEGKRKRTQVFMGTVIARKGTGLSETFSVHRVAYGEGMERVFLLHSPRISKIEVVQEGDVRRGKLYHLRGTHGKKARVKKRVGPARLHHISEEALPGEEVTATEEKPAAEEEVLAAPQPEADTPKPEEQASEKAPAASAE